MPKSYITIVFLLIFIFCGLLIPYDVTACGCNCDPCLLVYPIHPTTYHYNPYKYYTVIMGHPLYDPIYDRGGEVLIWDKECLPDRIAYEIYQAPNLVGFQEATGYTGFYFTGVSFDIVIDGWSTFPTTRSDVKLIFKPIPGDCLPTITVDGEQITGPPYRLFLGDLVVSTPITTPTRTYYSDSVIKSVEWSGCIGLYMYAFEDCDHDHEWLACDDCDEEDNCCLHCHKLCAHGAVVPVEQQTWGAIKSLFK